jgi:type IV pilus assembly protein PilW
MRPTSPVRPPRPAGGIPRAGRGFTLLELLVGCALSTVVLGAVHSFYHSQIYALAAQNRALDLHETARGTLEVIARDLRMATYDPSGAALPVSPGPACPGVRQGVAAATPTSLRLLADLDGDGTTLGAGEDVTYTLDPDNNRILRTDAGTTTPLAENVAADGLAFRYFDAGDPAVELIPAGEPAGLAAGQRDCVARVEVAVHVRAANPDPRVAADLRSAGATRVAIRSRTIGNL